MAELGRSWWTRLAWLGVMAPVVFAVVSAFSTANEALLGTTAALELWSSGLKLSMMLGGGLFALAAAGMRADGARVAALRWLHASRGVGEPVGLRARAVAAWALVTVGVGGPWCLASLVFAGLTREGRFIGLALAALVCTGLGGLVLGGLATLCAEQAARRGRVAFIALLLATSLLEEALGGRVWSLSTAFDAIVTFVLRPFGLLEAG